MDFGAEKAAWSGAPEIVQYLAYEKAQCDEGMAQIRSGMMEANYAYWFGKMESMWRYIRAVGDKAKIDKAMDLGNLKRTELWDTIIRFNQLANSQESIMLLEQQRLTELVILKGKLINCFDEFYQQIMILGVQVGLLSYQKGGNMQYGKGDRVAGVPRL
jgi:hypothetical protein